LNDLYELSPSHEACIDDLGFYCFEGTPTLIKKPAGFVTAQQADEEEIPEAEVVAVSEALADVGLTFMKIVDVAGHLYRDWKKTGNAFLRYQQLEISGEKIVRIEAVDPMDIMYLYTEKGEPLTGIYSETFFEGYFREMPEFVNFYPFFREIENGVETIIHYKHQRDHGKWYGRPDSLAAIVSMLTEYQYLLHNMKVSASEVANKAIFAFKRKNTGSSLPGMKGTSAADLHFESMAAALRRKGTNKGSTEEVDGIGVITYPDEPPKMYSMEIDRDWRYFTSVMPHASSVIYHQGHRWSELINGHRATPGSIGGNVLIDQFKIVNTAIVKPTQSRWSQQYVNKLFELIGQFTGIEELGGFSLMFEDKITSLVGSLSGGTQQGTPIDEPIEEPETGGDDDN
jgi:hypothetical protein